MKIAEGYVHSSRGEIPGPPPLDDSPGSTCINWPLYPESPTVQLCITKKNPVIFFTNPPQKSSQKQAENSASFWSQENLSDSPECID